MKPILLPLLALCFSLPVTLHAEKSQEKKSPQASSEPAADSSKDFELKDPVATVNGEPISKAELEKAFSEALQASGMNVADLPSEQKLEGYRQILDSMIIDKLISKAAAGIKIPKEKIEAEIQKIKDQFSNDEEFRKQLESIGQSPEKFTELVGKMMQQRQWVESQISSQTNISEADAQKFYNENKEEFDLPEQVKARHILFRVGKNDPDETVKSQLAKAQDAIKRARAGEDFAKLASELSEEPGAKESGGDLGFFPKDSMVPEFAEAAFSLKPGEISDPVRTQFGWHVIKVEDRKAAGTTAFEEVKDQITEFLKSGKQRQAVNELIKELRDSAKIENTLPQPSPSE